ncbi:tRNA pseudouridine synthase B [Clostridium sp. K25]|uniref:tRNA pseudouridine synthase B n=1 Tax=Clostridium botulinum D str. 1873 TaxID=592027 RepID=A0A9P2G8D3_CLOBO|nr:MULTISPECIES: tRNA pseudouridine(55) synthase TruB [Clostridium]AYF54813.1 tRNA pseudouridine(55) synthase TruB [Clostridium novyi]EES91845.1 tRNA pseudouridine synthase B [Clostridium botulinum D str. 1873]KEI10402.1 tRNA pseudouridine synthase B [Clostridium sp. K25]MBO3440995.1 tRNA pseudouridine(55) synthase TruB [Clostridium haemolyticum]MCD3215764.1 tRNA pseudouridine(55) synthase TruB [Clostridium botulinum C]
MDGILNIYKPIGITSFDVVRQIKKVTGIKKIGHTGTLDPLATGVLPICIGKGTKIVDYLMKDFKVYKAELKLGVITDTYDREGKELSIKDVNVSKKEIIDKINSFKGNILQVPPMYSALKVNGKRLYELAREGKEVERVARPVTIYDIEILDISIPYIKFMVKCSKGTYIRSLCYDIGDNLGCGGAMWNLERVQSGSFNKDNSITLENLTKDNVEDYIIPIDDALSQYDKAIVNSKAEKLLINGVRIADKRLLNTIELNKLYRIYNEDNKFLGLGLRNNQGLKIEKLLL